ncbi:putative transglutaminase-like cysteine proteinase [Agrobacterium vitis]|nr:putative transglutaminase-like cysteine proteinase [Agrobacterium vitis]MBE1437626.1 putative transglutaminase-like cysteine proteinase [Agrobacterium vitis]
MTKKNTIGFAIIIAIAAMVTAGTASAGQAAMKLAGKTSQPIGHYEFCKTHAAECKPSRNASGPATLTPELWATLVEVNTSVNTTIRPETDMEQYGVEEVWAYPVTAGDCEDYVLLKRRELMDKGMSASDLLITVVLQPNGEGHAVLTVRTDRGEFTLDNMRNKIMLWSDTEYTYLKRQASDNPGQWIKIIDDRNAAIAALQTR